MFIQGLSARQDNAKQKQKHGAGRRQVVVGVMSLPSCVWPNVTSFVSVTGDSKDPVLEED